MRWKIHPALRDAVFSLRCCVAGKSIISSASLKVFLSSNKPVSNTTVDCWISVSILTGLLPRQHLKFDLQVLFDPEV